MLNPPYDMINNIEVCLTAQVENFDGQIREAIIGLTMNWKLIYVVYTIRKGDIFRIISARSVTKYERRLYEEQ